MKLPIINSKAGTVFATVILIIILGAGYFLWYIPVNQNEIELKRYRSLQNMAANVDEKISNSLDLLNTLMDSFKEPKTSDRYQLVAEYLKNVWNANFRLDTGTYSAPPVLPADKLKVPPVIKTTDTTITVNGDVFSIRLRRDKTIIEMTYTLKRFIAGLFPENTFDNYIIFKDTTVIYQTFQSGITRMVVDSLKNDKSAFDKNPVRNVSLSGTAYKLFSQQLSTKTQGKLTIAGLVSKSRYNTERNNLPNEIVILLSVIVLASIIALPWIKVYQMGSQDRMTASDGIFSLAVPMLLMSVLFFVFLCYSMPVRTGPEAFKTSAKNTAARLATAFSNEIGDRYRTLLVADNIISAPTTSTKSNVNAKANSLDTGMSSDFDAKVIQGLMRFRKDTSINQVNQMNSAGKETGNWSPKAKFNAPTGNYSNRGYFKSLYAAGPHLYLSTHMGKVFALEPVVSRITGDFTTVMSVRSKQNKLTTLSFNMQSLRDVILTPGFIFCMIDKEGKVLYHSNKAKQLNENLFEEFSAHSVLTAAVQHLTDTVFNTRYEGRQYKVYAEPVAGLPFTLLVMEDSSFISFRQVNNFTFTFSMLFAYFIILGLDLLILFAAAVRPAFYTKHYFDVSWMGPNALFRGEYNLSTLANIVIIIVLLGFWFTAVSFLEFVFIFLAAAKISYFFQNYLYLFRHKEGDRQKIKLKKRAAWTMGGLLVLMNSVALYYVPFQFLLLFEALVTAALFGLWYLAALPGFRERIDRMAGNDLSISFSLMSFSRLIITSGLPVALFFITIYNYNLRLVSRYRHIEFTNAVLDKPQTDRIVKPNVYRDGIWIYKDTVQKDQIVCAEQNKADEAANFMFRLLTVNNERLVPGIDGVAMAPCDANWRFSGLFEKGNDQSEYALAENKHFVLKSSPLGYELPLQEKERDLFRDIFLWLGFFAVLAAFFYTFKQVIKRLFSLNLPSNAGWPIIDRILLEDNDLNKLVFLIGVPGSGKMEHVISLVQSGVITGKDGTPLRYKSPDPANDNCFVADMFLIPNDTGATAAGTPANSVTDWNTMRTQALSGQHKLVIVNQFEYDIKNPESNRAKLGLLEDILQKNNCKVIIISTVHPVNFLDSVNHQITGKSSPEHDLERWHVLLGHFRLVIQKLETQNMGLKPRFNSSKLTGNWRNTLKYETQRGHMLSKMSAPIHKAGKLLNAGGMNSESITMKLGVTSHYFYMYIWQSLTKEEKFILYDLAEDGLVNPFDDYNLILLISKGLVIREDDGIIRLFNHGLRDFILTAIGKSEADSIQRQIEDNGNWRKLKIPITLLITAVLAFLFTSQKETYSDLFKYVTAAVAAAPLLVQVFNIFKSDPAQANKAA